MQEWDDSAQSEATFNWCRSEKRLLRFDVYSPRYHTIIEVDGAQHFQNVLNWRDDLESRQQRDVYKMRCCIENGLRVVRVAQEDVWKHQSVWKGRLLAALQEKDKVLMLASCDKKYDRHWHLWENNDDDK